MKSNNIEIQNLSMMMDQYALGDFKKAVDQKQENADKVLEEVYDVAYRAGRRASELSDKKIKYVVDMDDKTIESIQSGSIKLDVGKSGDVYAQLRTKRGYGKKLPIKEELEARGVSADDVKLALQNKAIEVKLDGIIESLAEIKNDISEIRQGQVNDRIGLLFSGQNLYVESKSIKNDAMRLYMVSQAIKSISDANAQFTQELRSAIEYIINKKYIKEKGKSIQKIREKIDDIHRGFMLSTQSYIMKAAIYYSEDEIAAMFAVLDEYGKLLEKMIIPVAGILSEHDENDVFLRDGTWEKRALMLASLDDFSKLIERRTNYLLKGEEV